MEKWLKDRKGRRLSLDDVEHYLKLITALKHTIRFQEQIDKLYSRVEENLINPP